ncbi:RNA polymerase sigma factor [Microbulbifer sp. ALW1]|uniref:RNA polymerase sigma factor n=1 Tax=Microbulbifer sp. (strain ALW1) TaxID=1516059 RepID=UPI00135808E5|nr:sigma-70 family RNA polymerase sigma factor [Microbulbifer sp. ALW1]
MFADKLCSLSDEDLLSLYCQTRSQKAFREIYQRYKDALFRYCAQMTPRDCIQVMETLWGLLLEQPPTLHGRHLKNWLYIQINKLLRNPAPPTSNPGSSTSEVEPGIELRSALEGSDTLSAIQQLPRQQRNVFLLFTECGLSLATVADIERLTLAQCRQALDGSRQAIEFTLNGSARKPWKSAATRAAEAAAAQAAAETETGTAVVAPQTTDAPKPVRPWGHRETRPTISAAKPATAQGSVEVAQA